MTQPSLVLPFTDAGAQQLALVGGKGASLAELVAAGLQVPGGFCVTTHGFRAFLDAVPDREPRLAALTDLPPGDVGAIRAAAAAFRETLADVPVPTSVAAAIRAAHEELGADQRYAVRSSATTEDLQGASFAGQHDTFLEVVGIERLLDRVRACWQSLYTDRAVAYRRVQGIAETDAVMAVVVQRMASAEVAGVLFTADPLSGRRDVCTMDASYGLGESVVSGIVSPDSYTVLKATGEVLAHHIGSKALMIVPLPDGGTEEVAVDPAAQGARALTDEEAADVAALGVRVEALKGEPQDIEWCIDGGAVYLLQSRPITSLFPVPMPQRGGPLPRVYVSSGHQQANPAAFSPMGNSLFSVLPPFGLQGPHRRSIYLSTAGHRVYVDFTELMLTRPFRTMLPRVFRVISPAISERLVTVRERPDYVAARSSTRLSKGPVLRLIASVPPRLFGWMFLRRPESAGERWDAFLRSYEDSITAAVQSAAPGASSVRAAVEAVRGVFPKVLVPMAGPILAPGMIGLNVLRSFLEGTVPDGMVDRISRGLDGNIVTRMDMQLGDLADSLRGNPELVASLTAARPDEAADLVRDLPGGPEFAQRWDAFLARWGHRGPGELDVAVPRWSDDPSSLMRSLVGMLHSGEVGDHRARHAEAKADAAAAQVQILEAAGRGPFGFLRRPLVRFLIRRVRAFLGMREHHKYAAVVALTAARRAIQSAAELAVQRGLLQSPDSVWMLEFDELIDAFEAPAGQQKEAFQRLRVLAAQRRVEHERFVPMFPPAVMMSTGEVPHMPALHGELPPGTLGGVPVSSGTVEGVARVLRDPAKETLLPGEILVAPFTDAAWTTLFVHAGGVVLEAGGAMSHGSVVAREYGIPAVVGVEGATTQLRTGQRIRVDGDSGLITPLDSDAGGPEG